MAKMSDCEEVAIERVESEQEIAHDKVPKDKLFKLKFKDNEKTYMILEYVLKRGRCLPYTVTLKGGFFKKKH